MDEIVLAVDPGRDKVGMAVVSKAHGTLLRCVASASDYASRGAKLAAAHGVHRIVVGDRTGSREAVRALALSSGLEVITVDEHRSSMEARQRYLCEHRGTGLCRFVPIGLRTPRNRSMITWRRYLLRGISSFSARRRNQRLDEEYIKAEESAGRRIPA